VGRRTALSQRKPSGPVQSAERKQIDCFLAIAVRSAKVRNSISQGSSSAVSAERSRSSTKSTTPLRLNRKQL